MDEESLIIESMTPPPTSHYYHDNDDDSNGGPLTDQLNTLTELILKKSLSAVKNAVIYGYRVRFIHAISLQLVQMKLNKGAFKNLLETIWKSVKMSLNHGKILAGFAIIYKSLLVFFCKVLLNRDKDDEVTGLSEKQKKLKYLIHFLSGFVGGSLVYGGLINDKWAGTFNESITTQITLYCLSRVMLALGRFLANRLTKLIIKYSKARDRGDFKHLRSKLQSVGWTVNSGLIWGLVMMFYAIDKDFYIQKSMKLSLDFIYGEKMYSWLEAFNYSR